MSKASPTPNRITQLWLDLTSAIRGDEPPKSASVFECPTYQEPLLEKTVTSTSAPSEDTQEALQSQCQVWLTELGLSGGAKIVRVRWNPRLHSTAGFARYPSWQIELNPKLKDFEGQTERTLKHELAHLIAYHRAGRKRIKPHGPEWRQACADLGIADEKAHHHLPFPRRTVAKNLIYTCPNCGVEIPRMKKFRRGTACLACCKTHSGGQYDERFRLKLKTIKE
mgnify:CR=1 FL=1